MDFKLLSIIIFSYLYGFFEILLSIRQRFKRKNSIVNRGDKGSIWFLFVLIGIGYFLSFSIGMTKTGRVYHWDFFFAFGAFLIIIGLIIRIYAINTLKQHFTYRVTKIENHELIETGLYKMIRHPGYLGQLFIFIGTAVSFSNWLSILSMMVAVSIGYLFRIRIEERFMIEQMGQKYLNYQKRTKKLIPFIF
jgi:protein-S-isoprenylcysteine O-methyltransferase Ste14